MEEVWRPLLEQWSDEWLQVARTDAHVRIDADAVRTGWLGFPPAAPARVDDAEGRLGRALPPSLRSFLLVTNGWRNTDGFVDRVAGADELAWLRDTDDAHWAGGYAGVLTGPGVDSGELLRRSLRVSLSGDACVLFLDPHDVDERGEWAAYRLASWSGVGPERYDSFRDLMEAQYVAFHALHQPVGPMAAHWDERVEGARSAVLEGCVDDGRAALAVAATFGRPRAKLLLLQLDQVLGNTLVTPFSVLGFPDVAELLAADEALLEELVPVVLEAHRITGHGDDVVHRTLAQVGPPALRQALRRHGAARAQPGHRLRFGNAAFDEAVHAVLDGVDAELAAAARPVDLTAAGARLTVSGSAADGHADAHRRAVLDAAWPALRAAMDRWEPVSPHHVAPVSLLADARLRELLTPERGRALLEVPRRR